MPRKIKKIVFDVNEERGCNYVEHFGYRAFAKAHPRYEELGYKTKAACLAIKGELGLNLFGAPAINGLVDAGQPFEVREELFVLARLTGIPHWQLYWWYWSDAGWAEFQRLWADLPEQVSIVVHTPSKNLCTSGEVIHICTQVEYAYPTG